MADSLPFWITLENCHLIWVILHRTWWHISVFLWIILLANNQITWIRNECQRVDIFQTWVWITWSCWPIKSTKTVIDLRKAWISHHQNKKSCYYLQYSKSSLFSVTFRSLLPTSLLALTINGEIEVTIFCYPILK